MAKDSKALSKSNIADHLSKSTGTTKRIATQFLDDLTSLAYKEAKNSFTIPGVGKLVLVNRKARMGRNPATDQDPREARREVPRLEEGEGRHPRGEEVKTFSPKGEGAVPRGTAFLLERRAAPRVRRQGVPKISFTVFSSEEALPASTPSDGRTQAGIVAVMPPESVRERVIFAVSSIVVSR